MTKSDIYKVIRRPIITEKGLAGKETQHTVVFEVAADATKTQIKEAVQQIFKVKVDAVRTAIFHGKFRRRGRAEGHRRGWKKAYVKLAAGGEGGDNRDCLWRSAGVW